MSRASSRSSDGMRKEYAFSTGTRGKYSKRFVEGSNVVVLDPDVARLYRDAKAVNRALRPLAEVAPRRARRAKKA